MPQAAVSTVLRAVSLAFNCRFPTGSGTKGKSFDVTLQLRKGLEAIKVIGQAVQFANWKKVR